MNNTTVLANQSWANLLPLPSARDAAELARDAAGSAWSLLQPTASLLWPGVLTSAANAFTHDYTVRMLQRMRNSSAQTADVTEHHVTAASGSEGNSQDSFHSAHSNADDDTDRGTVCMTDSSQPPCATDSKTVPALNNEPRPVSHCLDTHRLDTSAVSAQPQTSLPYTGNPSAVDAGTQSTNTPQFGRPSVANSGPQSWLNTSVAAANHGTSVTGPHGCDGQSGFHIESKDLTRADVTITTYSPSGSASTSVYTVDPGKGETQYGWNTYYRPAPQSVGTTLSPSLPGGSPSESRPSRFAGGGFVPVTAATFVVSGPKHKFGVHVNGVGVIGEKRGNYISMYTSPLESTFPPETCGDLPGETSRTTASRDTGP